MAESKITIGYWGGFHGMGFIVKLAAEIAGVPYDFKPVMAREEYYGGLDQTLDTNFPNLPYIIIDGKTLTQTQAIMQAIAYKANKEELIGKTPCEKVKQTQLHGVALDLRTKFIMKNFSNVNFKKEKDAEYDNVKFLLERIQKDLGDKKFFTGDNVTFADISFFMVLSAFSNIYGDKFHGDFPKLAGFLGNFKGLPEVTAFFASERFNKNITFFPPTAQLGI